MSFMSSATTLRLSSAIRTSVQIRTCKLSEGPATASKGATTQRRESKCPGACRQRSAKMSSHELDLMQIVVTVATIYQAVTRSTMLLTTKHHPCGSKSG